jgi:histidyl-tRNA synthetase
MKVSVNPPSGFRDFLPAEASLRLSLIELITRVYLSHGFQPIGMPVLENLETLQGKGGGGDNEKLIFKVLKRGEDLERSLEAKSSLADAGLRFDLTLPLARYCARFREQLPRPFKVFQIGPVWRADRPQKGRYREFFQCDLDVVGSKDIGSEVDCLSAIQEVFDALKISGVEFHLNDRRLLAALRDDDFTEAEWAGVLVALDKLDKIGPEGVQKEWQERFGRAPKKLAGLLASKEFQAESFRSVHAESIESLTGIIALLNQGGARAIFNPTLVRGQDYYTGTIFEVRHPQLAGSLAGGGRYNRLLEVFGSSDTPAFGASIGFERLYLLLQEQGFTQGDAFAPQIFLPLMDVSLRPALLEIAAELRRRGIRADVYPDEAKLKNQFKYADERKIPFVAILGADEWQKKEIKVKDMGARTETTYSLEPLSGFAAKMEQLCKR